MFCGPHESRSPEDVWLRSSDAWMEGGALKPDPKKLRTKSYPWAFRGSWSQLSDHPPAHPSTHLSSHSHASCPATCLLPIPPLPAHMQPPTAYSRTEPSAAQPLARMMEHWILHWCIPRPTLGLGAPYSPIPPYPYLHCCAWVGMPLGNKFP